MALWRNTALKYGIIARSLHWLLAIGFIGMLAVGFYMADMAMSPDKIQIYGWHKSTGIILLGLVATRLLWRWLNTTPSLPGNTPTWQRLAAHLGHYGLYAAMFAMPLIGWMMSSAAGGPVSVFGWFTLPPLVAPDEGLVKLAKFLHYWVAVLFVGLIIGHVLAALYHHFVRKDHVLRRMLPW